MGVRVTFQADIDRLTVGKIVTTAAGRHALFPGDARLEAMKLVMTVTTLLLMQAPRIAQRLKNLPVAFCAL